MRKKDERYMSLTLNEMTVTQLWRETDSEGKGKKKHTKQKQSHFIIPHQKRVCVPRRARTWARAAILPLLLNMCISLSACLPYLFGLRVSVCLSICSRRSLFANLSYSVC